MTLADLLCLIKTAWLVGDPTIEITGIQIDSRKVNSGDLYVCLPGVEGQMTDRHLYAQDAVNRGAVALVVEHDVPVSIPKIFVKNSRFALAVCSNHLYNYPSNELRLIGITGTNGKTTTASLLGHILNNNGLSAGVLGNLGMRFKGETVEYCGNTPESPDLQRYLRVMRQNGIDYCVMEVSSHGLDMGRVMGCNFSSAIFTNLTHDHLDYHKTMENYILAKSKLFSGLGNQYTNYEKGRKYAIINIDDPHAGEIMNATAAQIVTYGINNKADVYAEDINYCAVGIEFMLVTFAGKQNVRTNLVGKFNIYNVLGAITAALIENVPLEKIAKSLENVPCIEGRMDTVSNMKPLVIVDYAHTPDGLESALLSIRKFASGRLISVFGCGGDRDRSKRPLMGAVSSKLSNHTIVTSDNPRNEDPYLIMKDIIRGLEHSSYEAIEDRQEAIFKAILDANDEDVILIAGKGHEKYQVVGEQKKPFDDKEVAKMALNRRKSQKEST